MSQTLKAIVRLVIEVIVAVAPIVGISVSFDVESLYTVVAALITAVVTIYASWKNHNFTSLAANLQQIKDACAKEDLDVYAAVQNIVEELNDEVKDDGQESTDDTSTKD